MESVQTGTQSELPDSGVAGSGVVEFDEAIHDITNYEKKEIIALRNEAFKHDTIPAKKIKGILLGLPQRLVTYH